MNHAIGDSDIQLNRWMKFMMDICGYQFEGPFDEARTDFNEVSTVYVILDVNNKLIDVGETDQLKTRLSVHERRDCWERNCGRGNIYVAAYRSDDQSKRLLIEKQIRGFYTFPCGKV